MARGGTDTGSQGRQLLELEPQNVHRFHPDQLERGEERGNDGSDEGRAKDDEEEHYGMRDTTGVGRAV